MRKLTAAVVLLSGITVAAPAFAALDACRNEKGEEVKVQLKDGKLVDEKGAVLHDGEWTWVKDGKSTKITVQKGQYQIKNETIPPIKANSAKTAQEKKVVPEAGHK
jgi:hypothetical protein